MPLVGLSPVKDWWKKPAPSAGSSSAVASEPSTELVPGQADTLRLAFFAEITGKLTAVLDSSFSHYNYRTIAASQVVTNGGDRSVWAIRPGLTYQILRPWRLSAAYAYELTDFAKGGANLDIANIGDHRFTFASQFALRQWLLLDLSYRYSTRQVSNGIPLVGVEPFYRNEVILRLTAAPSFLF